MLSPPRSHTNMPRLFVCLVISSTMDFTSSFSLTNPCEARGAVITAAVQAGLPIYEYEPRRMKKAVCGNGLAEKGQIQRMIRVLLNLPEVPQNDAADALGLAIAHVHSLGPLSLDKPI